MSSSALLAAVATYKERIIRQWYVWTCFLFIGVLVTGFCIHLGHLRHRRALKQASENLTKDIDTLTDSLKNDRSISGRLKNLKALSPYFLSSSVYAILLSIAKTIPDRTFLTSFSLTPQRTLVLTGFSHSKKELRAFTKALTNQQIFPCRVKKTILSGSVGTTFTLFLVPLIEISAPKKDNSLSTPTSLTELSRLMKTPSLSFFLPLQTFLPYKKASYSPVRKVRY